MKQLQNNFTTHEQSKRLLELGIPADSADCVFELKRNGTRFIMSKTPDIIPITMRLSWRGNNRIPCWSVGRLIEIITICCNHYSGNNDIIFNQDAVNHGIIECLVAYLAIEKKDVSVDFSKLEE